MSSPFPGMDPYFEGPRWTGLHSSLGVELARQLAPQVRPRYLVVPVRAEIGGSPHVHVDIEEPGVGKLITTIRILSPTTKMGEGRCEYLAGWRSLLLGDSHLLEIDLLHDGPRTLDDVALPATAYQIVLSRAEARPRVEVWPVALSEPLPTIPVPLLPGDADAQLDLQQAFTTVYELFYQSAIDYAQPPPVSLPPEEAQWVDERLKAAGLR